MTCKNCIKEPVWEFTNKQKLCRKCFIVYFEKKVKSTIRKYNMPITFIKKKGLKAEIINKIILGLPKRAGITDDKSLDEISAGIIFEMMHKGNIGKFFPKNQPLYFLSDKEIRLYAKIKKIKGKLFEREGKIESFLKFLEQKNPDIRHNVVNAVLILKRNF